MHRFDRLWVDVHLFLANDGEGPFGEVSDGAIAVRDGRIAWLGRRSELPGPPESLAPVVHEGGGTWLGPGLIDCHTHLVFGGDRSDEFERRLAGESYESIARAGGGIRSTVRATRSATDTELFESARQRVEELHRQGVTTVEIKSGYGLDTETECAMLRIGRALGEALPPTVRTTFLGAHALPVEYQSDRKGYVEMVVSEMLPAVTGEGLADQADAFLESIAFDAEECRTVLSACREAGLTLRLHADQLEDGSGAALAAELGAASADHLEYTSDAGARAMGGAGTVAVLLPGAYYSVGADQPPPVDAFRRYGVPMAVATDLNPGSSPLRSILLALNMACTLFGLRPHEALHGVTSHAAAALALADRGRLAPGLRGDLSLWAVGHPRELCYWIGGNPCTQVFVAGEPTFTRPE